MTRMTSKQLNLIIIYSLEQLQPISIFRAWTSFWTRTPSPWSTSATELSWTPSARFPAAFAFPFTKSRSPWSWAQNNFWRSTTSRSRHRMIGRSFSLADRENGFWWEIFFPISRPHWTPSRPRVLKYPCHNNCRSRLMWSLWVRKFTER